MEHIRTEELGKNKLKLLCGERKANEYKELATPKKPGAKSELHKAGLFLGELWRYYPIEERAK